MGQRKTEQEEGRDYRFDAHADGVVGRPHSKEELALAVRLSPEQGYRRARGVLPEQEVDTESEATPRQALVDHAKVWLQKWELEHSEGELQDSQRRFLALRVVCLTDAQAMRALGQSSHLLTDWRESIYFKAAREAITEAIYGLTKKVAWGLAAKALSVHEELLYSNTDVIALGAVKLAYTLAGLIGENSKNVDQRQQAMILLQQVFAGEQQSIQTLELHAQELGDSLTQ
jgi:hypothetical protein